MLFHLMVLTPLSKKVESTLNMSLFFFQFLLTCISVKEKMNQQWYKIQLPFAFSWVLFKVLYLLIIHWQWFFKSKISNITHIYNTVTAIAFATPGSPSRDSFIHKWVNWTSFDIFVHNENLNILTLAHNVYKSNTA